MPRPNKGPRLELYGPDHKYGAKPRKGFKRYQWYIVWSEHGKKNERTTSTSSRGEAEQIFARWLQARECTAQRTTGSHHPDQMMVAEALTIYGEHHAPHTVGCKTIGSNIKALVQWWQETTVSAVTAAACRRYAKERNRAAWTIRRELGTLSAALRYCVVEGYLTQAPPVWLSQKGPARERWLTRNEAARLLRAACQEPHVRLYLPLFILIGLYTGARKEAILSLQWQQNSTGGWVDLDRGLIDFRTPGQETKKRRSRIPIHPRLELFLQSARKRTQQYVIERNGQRILDFSGSFNTACRRAGLINVIPHTLRHTAVTWLVQAGVPLWEISQFVGLTITTIEHVYGHMAPDCFARIMKAQR